MRWGAFSIPASAVPVTNDAIGNNRRMSIIPQVRRAIKTLAFGEPYFLKSLLSDWWNRKRKLPCGSMAWACRWMSRSVTVRYAPSHLSSVSPSIQDENPTLASSGVYR